MKFRIVLTCVFGLFLAACAQSPSPSPLGPHIPSVFSDFDLKESPTVLIDADGIPRVRIWSTGNFEYNPTTVAQWGLGAHARFTTNKSPVEKEKFLKAANWLMQHQNSNGGFPLMFDHLHPDPRSYKLKAPWYSALSQGNAAALLIRAYQETGDARYKDSAKASLKLFNVSTSEGGLRGDLNGAPWYEETPDPNAPNHIFGGFVFSILGIHDYYLYTRDANAWRLWQDAEASLRKNLDLFVTKSTPEDATLPSPWSTYDVEHIYIKKKPMYVENFYMGIHIKLMKEMFLRTNYAPYRDIAEKWEESLAIYRQSHKS
jgi:heparosan-N-sulfate-glucuronate 5-epimerase